ncbi:MLX-interacting protein [Araneus ventricosus]|uniref:MLX-interacting protein n=1 Tax=Araneus ventricosus TaxID=182803 RepID=A0A4Y2D9F9_ARAVE|nr:MLX-interacting protein [Araneus ventricosus]
MPPDGRKRQKSDQKAMKEIIHSGHFMVSDIDDPEVQDGDDVPSLVVHESDCDQESLPLPEKGFDFESACKETSKTYTFGSRSTHSISIDASLTKLFECMTLAYSGKLTSPRWKQFKGLKLRLKEKIRLNNMIWRAWHMQFVMKIKTDKLCQFATPLDGDTHMKPEAVVIEGTYWKRRMANITAEYKKWRLFYRDRFRLKPNQETEKMDMDWDARWPSWPKDAYTSLQSAMDEDFIMDFTDTLFTSFNPSQPFDFPNPKEIAAKAGIADFIQPGLVQLQPAVDDFMDTFEPLSDLFSDFLNSKLPPLPEEGTYNCNSFQDLISPGAEQQDSFSGPGSKMFGRHTPNFFSRFSAQVSGGSSLKRSKKPLSSSHSKQIQQPSYMPSSPYSGKAMLDNMNFTPENSALLSENVPLLPSEQLPSQSDSIQPFLCNTVSNQPSQESTIESLLQGNLQSKVRNLQPTPESLSTMQVPAAPQMVKREQTNQFFQHPAFKPYSETDLSRQHMTQNSIQVPLQTIPQVHIAENIISNSNANDNKTTKHPLFFSVSLGQANHTQSNSNSFKVPAQLQQVANISASVGNVYQPNLVKQNPVSHADSPAFRRHSYTTGQPLQSVPQNSGDFMGSRRSRPIAPATTSVANFAVPEVPPNRRTRSRSVSSPQSSSPKPVMHQPVQAVSLTDISSSLPAVVSSADPSRQRTTLSSSLGQTVNVSNSNVLQQNAILAQLLAPGCTQQDIGQTVIKVTNAATANVTSPVTIIRPLLSSTAHTFVFSPLSMGATSGVGDLQQSLFVSSANSSLAKQDSPPTCVLPTPDSPGSSTCSSSPAISGVPFESPSTSKSVRLKSDEEKVQYKEHRRVCHINAEQKRRCNIKNGFESLHNLLPPMGQTPSSKISKAAMLQRGAEYIRTLKSERQQQMEEVEMLKKQIDELNQAINVFQSQLPASGAPIPCQRTNKMKEMFSEYVRQQTLQNWKFYIFSLIIEPLVESFNNNVSTASVDEMCKSILTWLEQHCSLVTLRPRVLNSLRHLSTTTSILSDPSRVPEEAIQAVTKKENNRQ